MKHLNSHSLVAIDIQTSGPQPRFHDLLEVAAVVLKQDLTPDKSIMPLHLLLRPVFRNYDNHYVSGAQMHTALTYPDIYDCMYAWERWYEKVVENHRKRIIPVVSHWHQKQPFVLDWMQHDEHGRPNFYEFFHNNQVRDVAVITAYLNDLGHFNNEYFPFPKDYLRNYARRLGVHWPKPETALNRALVIGEVYAKVAKASIKAGLGLPLDFPADNYTEHEDQEDDSPE